MSCLKITVAITAEARMWYERLGAVGDWAEPDGLTFMTIRTALESGTRLFLAWQDGQSVGGGALEVHDGVAAHMAADTLPDFRHQGIHTALMQVRLAAVAEAAVNWLWFMPRQAGRHKAIFCGLAFSWHI